MEDFKNRLRTAMNIRNVKQSDLANRTSIDKGAISAYLSGKYKPKQDNLYLIANALNINVSWLMGYDVSMENNNDQFILGTELTNLLSKISTELNVSQETIKEIFIFKIYSKESTVLNYKNLYEAIKTHMDKTINSLFENNKYSVDDDIIECLNYEDLYKFAIFVSQHNTTLEGKKVINKFINEVLSLGELNYSSLGENNHELILFFSNSDELDKEQTKAIKQYASYIMTSKNST